MTSEQGSRLQVVTSVPWINANALDGFLPLTSRSARMLHVETLLCCHRQGSNIVSSDYVFDLNLDWSLRPMSEFHGQLKRLLDDIAELEAEGLWDRFPSGREWEIEGVDELAIRDMPVLNHSRGQGGFLTHG